MGTAAMKAWLKDNEPYLRAIEVVVVVVVGGVVSVAQLFIANRQADIAEQQEKIGEKSLEVAAAELKLVKEQTELQRLDRPPYFVFDHSGVAEQPIPARLVAKNKSGGEVRSLDGIAKLFLLIPSASGDSKRLLIDNFYRSGYKAPTKGELLFYNNEKFIFPKFFGMEMENYYEDGLRWHAVDPKDFPMPFTIYNYVEVSYVTEDHRKVTQRFDMKFPDRFVTPIAEEPKYDKIVDLAAFPDDWKLEYEKTFKAVVEAVEELKK